MFPYLYVAKLLRQKGHSIVFCCSIEHTSILQNNQFMNYETDVVNSEIIRHIINQEQESGNVNPEMLKTVKCLINSMIKHWGIKF